MSDTDQAPKLRMNAYYYGFDNTDAPEIDLILSAVACAGKSSHHTNRWEDEIVAPFGHEGGTPVDWIANAARKAAMAWRSRADHARALRSTVEQAVKAEREQALIDDLLADSKRLNALETALKHKDGSGISWNSEGYKVVLGYGSIGHAKTLRAAIDAAMQEQSNE